MLDYPPTLCVSYNHVHVVLRFFFPWVYQEYLEKDQPYPRIRLSKVSEDNTKICECVSMTRLRRYVFLFKQCHSLKNHRELGKVYCHLDYMIWPFLSVDWFDPTLGQKLIKYCIHHVPTLCTGAVGTFTHTHKTNLRSSWIKSTCAVLTVRLFLL